MTTRPIAFIFILIGISLSYVITKQVFESLAPYGWEQTICQIKRSEVAFNAEEENRCKHILEYQYEFGGTSKYGNLWRLDPGVPYSWCRDWASFASRFPPETSLTCYVDPEDSNRAVLDQGNIFSILKLIFPLGILLIGILKVRSQSSISPPTKAGVKRIARSLAACLIVTGFIAIFFWSIPTLYESYQSASWRKAECQILSSALRTSSSNSTTPGAGTQNRGYYIDIVYSYAVDGRTYISDRYDFNIFGSGSAKKLSDLTNKYPIGATVFCSVNPNNPYEAVLMPGFSAKYLWVFLPLIAVFIGLLLFVAARKI